jgi:hypothetical protein
LTKGLYHRLVYTDCGLPRRPLLAGTVAGSIKTGEGIPRPFHRQRSPPCRLLLTGTVVGSTMNAWDGKKSPFSLDA